jgi:predicted metal-dependent hydrolase
MTIERHEMIVGGVEVSVVRKAIKNLHLGVYPPNGRVRVATPLAVSDEAVRLAVVGKLGWIKRQQARFASQSRQSRREMVSGESHYFQGRRYRLRVITNEGTAKIVRRNNSTIELHVRPEITVKGRERILQEWYRQHLRELIPALLEKWQAILGVRAKEFGIKKMKTKWGTCNIEARRIWINLELAKKPVSCLEYIIVHELTHLLERHHNPQFTAIMDRYLPTWRMSRKELNSEPLANENWSY